MTLTEILAELYRRLALPAVPNPTETTRLTSFINITHRQILGLPGMELLRNSTIVSTTKAGQSSYGLPVTAVRIEGITDRDTHRKLQFRTLQEVRASDPGLTATGPPDSYVMLGTQAVHTQPVDFVYPNLYAKSSADVDVNAIATVEGVNNNGFQIKGSNTLQGVTPVALYIGGAGTYFKVITKFYLSDPTVGTVQLYAGSVPSVDFELSQIWPPMTFARFLGVQLYPTPAAVGNYYVDYVRGVTEMVDGTDEPFLPLDFHWVLVEGSLLKEWTRRDDDRRVAAEREYAKGLSALKYFVTCQGDDLPVSGTWPRVTPHSRFGPWYPAMRY